ncbi:MAG: hypothetical protein JNK87_13215 [Bryobacterales bacterium]|nr:hypothetical protein [Bryobacterales bacterium]
MPKNNVVADHFKVRGRMPQGRDVAHEVEKQQYGQTEKAAGPKGKVTKAAPKGSGPKAGR